MKYKYKIWNKKDVLIAEFNDKRKADKSLKALADITCTDTLTVNWD